jgi:DNA-binding MarR family transcriptional regulator
MSHDNFIDRIQRAYPRIWHACHVEHRTRSAPHDSGLTDRESGLLAHIDAGLVDVGTLTAHLGIAKSTMSAHLARLESLGLVGMRVHEEDQRRRVVELTDAGRVAQRQNSVLDADRLASLLAQLTGDERERAVQGIELLAGAAQRMTRPG